MILCSAVFVCVSSGKTWHVLFLDELVKLYWHSQTETSPVYIVANQNRTWKPCKTHAQDLIRMHTQQPPRCNQAAQRVAKTQPQLCVWNP
jgi:hypothetical protein